MISSSSSVNKRLTYHPNAHVDKTMTHGLDRAQPAFPKVNMIVVLLDLEIEVRYIAIEFIDITVMLDSHTKTFICLNLRL
jgi:hypothetical protein